MQAVSLALTHVGVRVSSRHRSEYPPWEYVLGTRPWTAELEEKKRKTGESQLTTHAPSSLPLGWQGVKSCLLTLLPCHEGLTPLDIMSQNKSFLTKVISGRFSVT